MKTCTKCGVEKELSEFCNDNTHKYGVSGTCKECKKEYDKKYRCENKAKLSESAKKHRVKNRIEIKKTKLVRQIFNLTKRFGDRME